MFEVFKETGPVIDVFLPRDNVSGVGRGFCFVHFKSEWDANCAIQRLNGIGVKKAQYAKHNMQTDF